MRLNSETVARASARRPWRVVALWLVVLAVSIGLSATILGDGLTTDFEFTNEPEAKRAAQLVEDRFGEEGVTEILIVQSDRFEVGAPEFEEQVRALQAAAQEKGGDDLMFPPTTYYDTQDPALVSEDEDTTLIPLVFTETDVLEDYVPAIEEIVAAGETDGFKVQPFGAITLNEDFNTVAEESLRKGESIGILVALVVLVAVFGAVVAGIIPIILGVASIAVALGMVALVGQLFDFSFFVTNMVSMMGLAVGIDYSLFIVSRFREERHQGLEKLDAISMAGATASRAVFFSGMTVVFALLGMLIIPTTIFRSLAAGAIFVVLIAVAASLTLLPAVLSLLGDRINKLRVFRHKGSLDASDAHPFWDRITHAVMARPVISLIVGAGLLIAASLSYFDINTGFNGVTTLPENVASRQAFETLTEEFGGASDEPVEIVVSGAADAPESRAALADLQESLESDGTFGFPQVRYTEDRETALMSAPLLGDPNGDAATDAIDRIRDDYVPKAFAGTEGVDEVLVGGSVAFANDFFDITDTYTPIVFLFVLGLSFLLLMTVFRSIVVPIKAIFMNLLSVGAAYGLIVLVFQKGVGAGIFGFDQVEQIEAWLPLMLFSVLFGLSMDYHVFLLSRIRERFDQTHDNKESVAYGLRTTGGLITGAAIIMVAVFGGFASGDLVMLQQMGFGLAVAVFIDATLVRSVLVPASMRLLGNANWYLPRRLQWLPDLSIEGPAHAERVQQREPAKVP